MFIHSHRSLFGEYKAYEHGYEYLIMTSKFQETLRKSRQSTTALRLVDTDDAERQIELPLSLEYQL